MAKLFEAFYTPNIMLVEDPTIDHLVERLQNIHLSKSELVRIGQIWSKKWDKKDYGKLGEYVSNHLIDDANIPGLTMYNGPSIQGSTYNFDTSQNTFWLNSKRISLTEVDGLFFLDDLPVVVEVKLGRSKRKMWAAMGRSMPRETSRALQLKHAKDLQPLMQDVFGTGDFAYILIVHPGQYAPYSSAYKRFKERGGYALPFFSYMDTYRDAFLKLGGRKDLVPPRNKTELA